MLVKSGGVPRPGAGATRPRSSTAGSARFTRPTSTTARPERCHVVASACCRPTEQDPSRYCELTLVVRKQYADKNKSHTQNGSCIGNTTLRVRRCPSVHAWLRCDGRLRARPLLCSCTPMHDKLLDNVDLSKALDLEPMCQCQRQQPSGQRKRKGGKGGSTDAWCRLRGHGAAANSSLHCNCGLVSRARHSHSGFGPFTNDHEDPRTWSRLLASTDRLAVISVEQSPVRARGRNSCWSSRAGRTPRCLLADRRHEVRQPRSHQQLRHILTSAAPTGLAFSCIRREATLTQFQETPAAGSIAMCGLMPR